MAITSDKDIQQLKKRFAELARKAELENRFMFTDFLGLSELAVFYRFAEESGQRAYEVYGGHALCERQMVRFGSVRELGYELPFPIVCIHIRPRMKKFAQELSHRDFLGALMNLGIERSTFGDIFVQDREAYVYAQESIAPFIVEELLQIGRTCVCCALCEEEPVLLQREPEQQEYPVQSERLDGIVAKVYNLSRSSSAALFREKKVFVDGRLCENSSHLLKQGETVSVRGFGRFRYGGCLRENKKGKLRVSVERF